MTATEFPDDAVVVSYSELDTFRQCPLKHHLLYGQRWRKPSNEGSALSRGTLWHAVLETHYRRIQAAQLECGTPLPEHVWSGVLEDAVAATSVLLFDQGGGQTEEQELVSWMYRGYVEEYGVDPNWEILEVEDWFGVLLGIDEDTGRKVFLKGRIDLLVRDVQLGTTWVVDHKSGANLPSQLDLQLDDQFGLYQGAYASHYVSGTIHNATRTTRNLADKPGYTGRLKPQSAAQLLRRTFLTRGVEELDNIRQDALNAAISAYPGPARVPARYSAPSPQTCGWRCSARDAHLAMRGGVPEAVAMADQGFAQNFTRH